MMTRAEFIELCKMLRVYKNLMQTEAEREAWYESLKPYSFGLIDSAVREYIKTGQYAPTPAAIINLIPQARPQEVFKPRYETVNGKLQQVVQCRRCNDSGLILRTDANGYVYGRPCDCPAGHAKYTWGWLTSEEQQEYVRRVGNHGEVVGESWL